jgi:hypothetical protein
MFKGEAMQSYYFNLIFPCICFCFFFTVLCAKNLVKKDFFRK